MVVPLLAMGVMIIFKYKIEISKRQIVKIYKPIKKIYVFYRK